MECPIRIFWRGSVSLSVDLAPHKQTTYDPPRYLLRMPEQWDPETSPRPIVFLQGLGIGILQYHHLVAHFFSEFSDRPVLVPLQPHSSHDFFHPDFLNPPGRKVMSQRLANLIQVLGWARSDDKKSSDVKLTEDDEVKSILFAKSQRGVTMVSHSKYVFTAILAESVLIHN